MFRGNSIIKVLDLVQDALIVFVRQSQRQLEELSIMDDRVAGTLEWR
jgi:hypothetical protein